MCEKPLYANSNHSLDHESGLKYSSEWLFSNAGLNLEEFKVLLADYECNSAAGSQFQLAFSFLLLPVFSRISVSLQQQRQPPSQQSTVASHREQLLPFLMRGFFCFQCRDSSSHMQNKFPRHRFFCAAQATDLKKDKQSGAFILSGSTDMFVSGPIPIVVKSWTENYFASELSLISVGNVSQGSHFAWSGWKY